MAILKALLFSAALVCFAFASTGVVSGRRGRFNLVALGLAFFSVPFVIDAWNAVGD